MSNSDTQSSNTLKSKTSTTLSIVGIVGSFLLFVLILGLAYAPEKTNAVDMQLRASRKQMLEQNKAEQQQLLEGYAVVDAQNKIVRIPLERAIELTIAELGEGSPSGN